MYAVLEDAFLCFQKQFEIHGPDDRILAGEAEKWFFTNVSRRLFSFVSLCTALGLEPEWIRKRLKHWSRSCMDKPQGKI